MAVIVIMALAAGFVLPGVAAAGESAQCRATAAELLELDRKARLFARSEGMVALDFDSDARTFSLTVIATGERLTTLALDHNVEVMFSIDDDELPLHFDRSGRSSNYEVAVRVGAHAAQFFMTGATGRSRGYDP